MANVIVVGCGRVGSQLAGMLSDNGDNVCVVDTKSAAFENLGREFNGSTLHGVGFDEETLIRAGIDECDIFLAVTQLDTVNLMAVEVASKLFGVPHVIARLSNPTHERAYTQLGVDYVCDTMLVAQEMFMKAVSGFGAPIDSIGDYEIMRFKLNLAPVNKRNIKATDLERDQEVRIVAYERLDGSLSSTITRDSVLNHGDTVIAAVRHDKLDVFSKFIQG